MGSKITEPALIEEPSQSAAAAQLPAGASRRLRAGVRRFDRGRAASPPSLDGKFSGSPFLDRCQFPSRRPTASCPHFQRVFGLSVSLMSFAASAIRSADASVPGTLHGNRPSGADLHDGKLDLVA